MYPLTFDLHVLSTPPAFILSQDQTLRNLRSSPARSSASQPTPSPESLLKICPLDRLSSLLSFWRCLYSPKIARLALAKPRNPENHRQLLASYLTTLQLLMCRYFGRKSGRLPSPTTPFQPLAHPKVALAYPRAQVLTLPPLRSSVKSAHLCFSSSSVAPLPLLPQRLSPSVRFFFQKRLRPAGHK